jgi:thiamine monophosphate kinase
MNPPRPLPGEGLALGPGPEFDRIRAITGVLGAQGKGIGDDCALLRDGYEFIALSTDVSVEGVHFR